MLKKKWMGFCLWIGYLPWCTFMKNLYSCRRSMKINYNNSNWFGVDRIKGYKKNFANMFKTVQNEKNHIKPLPSGWLAITSEIERCFIAARQINMTDPTR